MSDPTDPGFHEDMTIRKAKEILRGLATGKGASCPVCNRFTKIYRRLLPNATCRVMIALYRIKHGREYVFLPDLLERVPMLRGTPHQGGYGTLGQYWGLMERQPGVRDDGSNRVGWWRLTEAGRAFVRMEAMVPSHATIYGGRCLGLSGDPITIETALGNEFNYRELMEGL